MKNPDVPKDLPVLTPAGKRPTLQELANLGTDKLLEDLQRALPGDIPVAAFNSSI